MRRPKPPMMPCGHRADFEQRSIADDASLDGRPLHLACERLNVAPGAAERQALHDADQSSLPQTIWHIDDDDAPFINTWAGKTVSGTPLVTILPGKFFLNW